MNRYQVQLLQNLSIKVSSTEDVDNADETHLNLGSPSTRSLLAYLILHRDQPLDRRRLAYLFWPRASETASRRNLRQYLHRVRRSLDPVDPDERLIETIGNIVKLSLDECWSVDVDAFEKAAMPPGQDLEQAVLLYSGDLLAEVYAEWVESERDRLRGLYLECLQKLSTQYEEQSKFDLALHYAREYLNAEPYLEQAHLRLMRIYYASGDRVRVQQQYDQLTELLMDEFGEAPMVQVSQAYDEFMAGTYVINSIALSSAMLDVSPPSTTTNLLPHRNNDPSLIGRQNDWSYLNTQFEAAQNANGRLILIHGEMGIGKTRLISDWLAQQTDGVYIFEGRSHEFEQMIPYAPLVQALDNADDLPWDLIQPAPPWLSTLISLVPRFAQQFSKYNLPLRDEKFHTIQGLGSFFLMLARKQPLVLFIDNLHWADGSTWKFLAYMIQQITHSQLLIIGSVRLEDLSGEAQRLARRLQVESQAEYHPLKRLTIDETEALLRQIIPSDHPDPLLLNRLHQETQGNPFFIIEIARAIREGNGDWTQSVPTDALGQRPTFAIPMKVQQVIESRLDKLDKQAREALNWAAAIGREFSFDLLQQISEFETPELLNIVDSWLARGLVNETRDGYDFTHEMLGYVAYGKISRARRQHIHFQIGEYLAALRKSNQAGGNSSLLPDAAQLAHHYSQSSNPAKALPFLTQAGQRALAVRSYAAAREYGLQALGLISRFPVLRDPEERIDLNLQLVQAYAFTQQIPQALELLHETERIAAVNGELAQLAQIYQHSSQLLWLSGRPAEASQYARRTLRHAEELKDGKLRFAALRMLSRTSIVLSQFDDAIAYLLRYIDLTKQTVSAPDGLPVIYGYLGASYARVGSWQRAIDAVERGIELAQAEPTGAIFAVACMQKAFVYAELREWRSALDATQPVARIWEEEEGMTPHALMLRCVIGKALSHLGQAEEGQAQITAALAWIESVDYRVYAHIAQLFLAQSLFATRDKDALVVAQRAVNECEVMGDQWGLAVGLCLLAKIDMLDPHRTDWIQAENNLLRSIDTLRQIRARPDLAHAYLAIRRLYDRVGMTGWAVDCHFRAVTIFEELGMTQELAEAGGQAAGNRTGAVVISGLQLTGPNRVLAANE